MKATEATNPTTKTESVLTPDEQEVFQALQAHRGWGAGCGWHINNADYTRVRLAKLVRKGYAKQDLKGVFYPTSELFDDGVDATAENARQARETARTQLFDMTEQLNRLLTHALSKRQPLALLKKEIELIREAGEALKEAQRQLER